MSAAATAELDQKPALPAWVTDPDGSIPVTYERAPLPSGGYEHHLILGNGQHGVRRAIAITHTHPGELGEDLVTLAAGAWAAIVGQCELEGVDPKVIECDRDMAEFIGKCWIAAAARCAN